MKLLFCENCGDLVTPSKNPHFPKFCECRGSCCWWIDPKVGKFAVWSQFGQKKVSVIGIHNALLTTPYPEITNESKTVEVGCLQGATMSHLIDETPNSYLFKQLRSLIVRFRPGFSNDSIFVAQMPENL